jgi:hypothetical protein
MGGVISKPLKSLAVPTGFEPIARSFVVVSVYGYPFTSALIEALRTIPSLRKISGFEKVSHIPSESIFSRFFGKFANSGLGESLAGHLMLHLFFHFLTI